MIRESRNHTHDVRDDSPRNKLAVLVPVFAVFVPARLVISSLAVNKENDEVEEVKVGDRGVEASWQGPCETAC